MLKNLIEFLDEHRNRHLKIAGLAVVVYLLICVALGLYWNNEPDAFDVAVHSRARLDAEQLRPVTGSVTTATLIEVASTLLDKPGGYLSNDITPPGVWLDNIPNWEFGALVQVRDLARTMRRDISRAQSQSTEDPDLALAEPQLHFDSESWIMPATENEYERGIRSLQSYLQRLSDPKAMDAQFFARADNLRQWLSEVEARLGHLSQRLSASVGSDRVNTDLAGDVAGARSTPAPDEVWVQTPWLEIDDVFYEARGTAWALSHFMRAVEIDFEEILLKKNAMVSLRQIIRELEGCQDALWSPMVLNGSGFGMLANHSLVMASYLARANAGVIKLQELLAQG